MRHLPLLPLLLVLAVTAAGVPAIGAPSSRGSVDDAALYNAAVAEAEGRNRAAIAAISGGDPARARVELAALREAFGRLVERWGKTRLAAVKGEPDGVTIMVDLPMRVVTAQMMIDFGRPDIATSSLVAVCRLLVALHVPPDPVAAAGCERDLP